MNPFLFARNRFPMVVFLSLVGVNAVLVLYFLAGFVFRTPLTTSQANVQRITLNQR